MEHVSATPVSVQGRLEDHRHPFDLPQVPTKAKGQRVTDVAAYPQRVLDLCSGVGMLGLAVRVATGAHVACTVERDSYAAACLMARMEEAALEPAPIWDDLFTFDCEPWRGIVDCVTAGFPCQPFSVAGARKGTDDDRWLWPGIVRIIAELQPPVVFLENVPGLLQAKGEEQSGIEICLSDLAAMGFDAAWGVFSASEVGASHLRRRVFILAVAHGEGEREREQDNEDGTIAREWPREVAGGSGGGMADAGSGQLQVQGRRQKERDGVGSTGTELGNATGTRWAGYGKDGDERKGEGIKGSAIGSAELADATRGGFGELWQSSECYGFIDGSGEALAHAEREGLQRGSGNSNGEGGWDQPQEGSTLQLRAPLLFAPGPSDPRWADILELYPYLAPAIAPVHFVFDGLADPLGIPYRSDQLRCCGNGVVPLTAAVAFSVLWRRIHE